MMMGERMRESIKIVQEVIKNVAADKRKVTYMQVLDKLISTPGIYFGPGTNLSKIVRQLGEKLGIDVELEEEREDKQTSALTWEEENLPQPQTPPKPIDEKLLKEKDGCLNRLWGIPRADFD